MKRTWWVKQVGYYFGVVAAVAILTGPAWATPVGTADVYQIVGAFTFNAAEEEQKTFRTTDEIGFRADYYDPNPVCTGAAPFFAQLFIFNSEGVFLQLFSASNGVGFAGPKSRGVFTSFASAASISLTPGTYTAAFLVRDCTNTKSIVLTPFLTFRVVAP